MILINKIKHKLKNMLGLVKDESPSYEVKRAILKEYAQKYNLNIFVETGTFFGDTVEFFKKDFKKVISIELAEELAKKAQKRFENDVNVQILQGDSGKLLSDVVKNENQPILFWLDGHYSSEFFIGEEFIKTAKAELDTPVEAELKNVLSATVNHIILIDDARLFNGINDYPSISKVKKIVSTYKKNYTVKVEKDIIQIYPV
jgi:hypothetical protein